MYSEPANEEALWRERASRGDALALGQIYDAYATRIYRYMYRRLGDRQLAEDLTGDVFVRLVEAGGTPRFCQGSLAPWIYRLAHNRLVDHFRRRREVPLPEDWEIAGEEDGELPLHRSELRAALNALTPEQQLVIALKFFEGFSNAEIAVALDKPEGAVKSLQHRGLDNLRRHLRPDD